ncbi:hypothetical protein [Eubacterium aggregans]|uniref:hypothetical protein n=1 Tax=Eubacterium aggregans TaxID=81409 RepID=UPI003F4199BE
MMNDGIITDVISRFYPFQEQLEALKDMEITESEKEKKASQILKQAGHYLCFKGDELIHMTSETKNHEINDNLGLNVKDIMKLEEATQKAEATLESLTATANNQSQLICTQRQKEIEEFQKLIDERISDVVQRMDRVNNQAEKILEKAYALFTADGFKQVILYAGSVMGVINFLLLIGVLIGVLFFR